MITTIILYAVLLLIPISLLVFSWFFRPVWLVNDEDLKNKWSKILVYSTIISYASGAIVWGLAKILNLASDSIVSPVFLFPALTMFLSFPILQSIYTDFKHRLVDRFILWATIIPSTILGILSFYVYDQFYMIVSYLIFIGIASIMLKIPAIGKSDGRAFMLLVATVFPIATFDGITKSMILFIVALVIYNVGTAIKNKDFPAGLIKRISMPMVPLILIPALLSIIISLTMVLI